MPIDFERPYVVQLTGRQLMLAMEVLMLELQKQKGNGNGWRPMNDDDVTVLASTVEAVEVPYDKMIEPALKYEVINGTVVWGS
jgi:hypothetical protein